MTEKIIFPPTYLEEIHAPLIFLAGPIQGSDNWHGRAIELISSNAPELYIASPKRPSERKGDFRATMYNEQVDWETHYLRHASNGGVIMFWLAKEAVHDCKRAYAQTTRFELAEWKTKYEEGSVNLVLGIEPGFTGERYIRRRFSQDCPDVPILNSLEETCKEAIRIARFIS